MISETELLLLYGPKRPFTGALSFTRDHIASNEEILQDSSKPGVINSRLCQKSNSTMAVPGGTVAKPSQKDTRDLNVLENGSHAFEFTLLVF